MTGVGSSPDCDGATDEPGASGEPTWDYDGDGDGLGSARDPWAACVVPDGFVANADDCDDYDAKVGGPTTGYRDADEDGFGDPEQTGTGGDPAPGVAAGGDTRPTPSSRSPGASARSWTSASAFASATS